MNCECCGKELGRRSFNRAHNHHLLPGWMTGVEDCGTVVLCTGCHTRVERKMVRYISGYFQMDDAFYLARRKARTAGDHGRNHRSRTLFSIDYPGGKYSVMCNAAVKSFSDHVGVRGMTSRNTKKQQPYSVLEHYELRHMYLKWREGPDPELW